jgi:hypothetical protein
LKKDGACSGYRNNPPREAISAELISDLTGARDCPTSFCFTPKSRTATAHEQCPLRANSGHFLIN